jgi:hypothetical protein
MSEAVAKNGSGRNVGEMTRGIANDPEEMRVEESHGTAVGTPVIVEMALDLLFNNERVKDGMIKWIERRGWKEWKATERKVRGEKERGEKAKEKKAREEKVKGGIAINVSQGIAMENEESQSVQKEGILTDERGRANGGERTIAVKPIAVKLIAVRVMGIRNGKVSIAMILVIVTENAREKKPMIMQGKEGNSPARMTKTNGGEKDLTHVKGNNSESQYIKVSKNLFQWISWRK